MADSIIAPHPDCERLSSEELQEALTTVDEQLKLVHELGRDTDLSVETWLIQERRMILAELARRNGHNFTSDYKNPSSEVKFEREVNAGELQRQAKEEPGPALTFPLLGQEGFIVKGWSHLLAAYPKTGKTELLIRIVAEWPEERIL